jgi:hypothetical protein
VDVLLSVIIVMGVTLLAVSVYMAWIGLKNVLVRRSTARYSECGHLRLNRSDVHHACWRCRHVLLGHPSRLIHH